MALNWIWIAFFVVAFAVAVFKTVFLGDMSVWSEVMGASFQSAATAFEISLGLAGILSLWLGLMKIGEQAGAANPTDVFMPILLATFISTFVGIVALCLKQRIRLTDPVLAAWLAGMALVIGGIVWIFSGMEGRAVERWSTFFANALLFGVVISFILAGAIKRINVYATFIEGAKEGFHTAVTIIPYLVAILVAIGMFRASGAMELISEWTTSAVAACGLDTQWVEALPTALMKPLSGSGSRGLMVDLMATHGPDAFVSRVSAAIQGSTDTMFYVLAVYFGSVGIRKTRYAVGYALLADFSGTLAGVLAAYLFFG